MAASPAPEWSAVRLSRGVPDGFREQGPVEVRLRNGEYSCGLLNTGEVKCWGYNIGGDDYMDCGVVTDTPDEGAFDSISVGTGVACGVGINGRISCWGTCNNYGQLEVPDGEFTKVTAGSKEACGLHTDGKLECWGGLAGVGEPDGGEALVYVDVSTSVAHTCAVDVGDTVHCWGSNLMGQAEEPEGAFLRVFAGDDSTCAETPDQELECWGGGNFHVLHPDGEPYRMVDPGDDHWCGIDEAGVASCWGENGAGERDVPDDVFIDIAAGRAHSCGVTSVGEMLCWGADLEGQASPPQL